MGQMSAACRNICGGKGSKEQRVGKNYEEKSYKKDGAIFEFSPSFVLLLSVVCAFFDCLLSFPFHKAHGFLTSRQRES